MSQFLTELKAFTRKRIPLADLKSLFFLMHPEVQNSPERGALLLRALRQLQEQNGIALPAAGSWEASGTLELPRWVTLVSEKPATAAQDYTQVTWVPELGFWPELKTSQLPAAKAINDFLRHRRGDLTRVPIKERSLQIFGDEKRLDDLREGTYLFGGRLSLETLGAFLVPLPLPYRPAAAPGKPVLVVENHNSFWSFGEWNQTALQYAAVIYGEGNAFQRSLDGGLARVVLEVNGTGVEYLGDLDPKGVSIPLTFNRNRKPGTPCVQPALAWYTWLLKHGTHRIKPACASEQHQALAQAWLGEPLGLELAALWQAQKWIPQESLGFEQLVCGGGG